MSPYTVTAMFAPVTDNGEWRVDILHEDGQKWRVIVAGSGVRAVTAATPETLCPTRAQWHALSQIARSAVHSHTNALNTIFASMMWKAGVKNLRVASDPVKRPG